MVHLLFIKTSLLFQSLYCSKRNPFSTVDGTVDRLQTVAKKEGKDWFCAFTNATVSDGLGQKNELSPLSIV